MTPHEKQAEQRARILASYSNAADCIIKAEETNEVVAEETVKPEDEVKQEGIAAEEETK